MAPLQVASCRASAIAIYGGLNGWGRKRLPRDCHGFDPNAILDDGQMQPRLAFKCERVGGETLKVAFRRCRGAAELPEMSLL